MGIDCCSRDCDARTFEETMWLSAILTGRDGKGGWFVNMRTEEVFVKGYLRLMTCQVCKKSLGYPTVACRTNDHVMCPTCFERHSKKTVSELCNVCCPVDKLVTAASYKSWLKFTTAGKTTKSSRCRKKSRSFRSRWRCRSLVPPRGKQYIIFKRFISM